MFPPKVLDPQTLISHIYWESQSVQKNLPQHQKNNMTPNNDAPDADNPDSASDAAADSLYADENDADYTK